MPVGYILSLGPVLVSVLNIFRETSVLETCKSPTWGNGGAILLSNVPLIGSSKIVVYSGSRNF
jgi:hypothetical protein